MALIICPECGKEISDKASMCIGCGFPISDYLGIKEQVEREHELEKEKFRCKCCGFQNEIGSDYCEDCGMRITEYRREGTSSEIEKERKVAAEHEFNGIYRYTFLSGKQEVYCPRCKSSDCSHYQEQKIIPEKKKTRYVVNLNPFRPFTLIDKKEKVKRKEQIVTERKFICNSCGKIFY